MTITHGKLEGRITIPTGVVVSFGDSAGGGGSAPLTAGDYYLSSADSGAKNLIAQLSADLTAASYDTWTFTIGAGEGGTGKVTISDPDGELTGWAITWSASAATIVLRDVLGFTADITGSGGDQVGANHAQMLWLPDSPIVSPYGAGDDGTSETDARAVESPAGHVSVVYSQRKTVQAFEWDACSHARARIAGESTTGESFQQFFQDAILGEHSWATVPGGPLRVYFDADDDATYTTYKAVGELLHGYRPEQVQQGWIGLWKISIDRLVKVPA